VVVTAGDGAAALREAAARAFCPTLAVAGSWAQATILDGKAADANGRARAYVCSGPSCSAPVSDPDALRALLARI